ncbi:MAG: hypothetical protein IJM78_05970 [Prevotella sp.]|nr:hypothetical protein [Prevotella sp.]
MRKTRANVKTEEVSKYVPLNDTQKSAIQKAYEQFLTLSDSASYKVVNPEAAAQLRYDAGKAYHKALMSILTEAQKTQYIRLTSAPEVKAKTAYRVSLLREGGNYSEAELEDMSKEIYDYLMLEKIVYVKDKYDFATQKNNISRLKQVQPKSLKESLNIEKQKGLGKVRSGSVMWN